MVLVTGGTGFLGAHLLQQLVHSEEKIRCIYRNKPFKYLPSELAKQVEWVQADVLDVITLEEVFQGINTVYHCAGMVSFDEKDHDSLMAVNAEGTANVVNACLNNGIKKLVHVSSVAAIGRSKLSVPIDEKIEWEDHFNNSTYAKSKHLAEMEVWRGAGEGLNILIVNPSILIGSSLYWDEGAPKLIKNIADGFPYYTGGTNGFVDARDVARIMISLMKSNISGERFIVNADNWSYQKLFTSIIENLGMKTTLKYATPFMGGIVWRVEWLKSIFTHKRRLITKETARTASQKVYYNNQKLLMNLPDFEYTPLDKTIADACRAFLSSKGKRQKKS